MNQPERLNHIEATLKAIPNGWPFLMVELKLIIAQHIERLITQDDEETRGRIKALRDLLDLPEVLESERQSITAAELPVTDSAFSSMD